MDNEKLFIYYHKSNRKGEEGLFTDIAVVKSSNLQEAKDLLSKYYDEIDEIAEIRFENNQKVVIVSDY